MQANFGVMPPVPKPKKAKEGRNRNLLIALAIAGVVAVALIVGSLAGGMSFEDVQREYALTVEDIRAALKFAGELVEQEQYHPLPG